MEDIHRFFRYMIPGLAFILEMYFLLWTFPQGVVEKPSITEGIVIILASSVIGWFLSVIYRTLFNLQFLGRFYPDHRGMINVARIRGHLDMDGYGGAWDRIPNPLLLTRRGAWSVVSSLWHGSRLIPESAFKNQERQSNYMHSFGTVLVGSIIALLLWLAIAIFVSIPSCPLSSIRFWCALCFSIFFILVSWFSYKYALEVTQGFVEIVLATKLDESRRNNRRPITIFVFPRDFSN